MHQHSWIAYRATVTWACQPARLQESIWHSKAYLRAYLLEPALVLCAFELNTGAGHICCRGSTPHQSRGAGLSSVLHHQLLLVSEQHLSLSSHHMQQVSPTCACMNVLQIFFLHFVPVHIGHKACVLSQMKQWLVSLDMHLISLSTDDV